MPLRAAGTLHSRDVPPSHPPALPPTAPRAAESRGRLLVVTDHCIVSAFLFQGLGLPPWYDLSALQTEPAHRREMTEQVNAFIDVAAGRGFSAFDVHEAFPIDLTLMDPRARVLRSVDRLLPQRRYAGLALLRKPTPRLPVQPRLRKLRRMTLDGVTVSETDVVLCLAEAAKIPLVYSQYKGCRGWLAAPGHTGAHRTRSIPASGRRLVLSFASGLSLNPWRWFPGVEHVDHARGEIRATVRSAQEWMAIYAHTGLVLSHAMPRRRNPV